MLWLLLLLVLIVGIVLLSLNKQQQVVWLERMRQLNPGTPEAEWMAPDYVRQQVRNDYLMAMRWMREAAAQDTPPPTPHTASLVVFASTNRTSRFGRRTRIQPLPTTPDPTPDPAASHLTGPSLLRYRHFAARHAVPITYPGVLQADHRVEVRHFAPHGEECYLIDHQTARVMVSGLHRQALDDSSLVYRMRYDRSARRWKIEAYVQELPPRWDAHRIGLLSAPVNGRTIGRDH